MLRQSSIRNQRSKGIKVKHVLQAFLLVAVFFWLIYQVKHSHDKRRNFDEKRGKGSVKKRKDVEILKLGRKDPDPQIEEKTVIKEKHDEEAGEEEETGEEKEREHEEQEERKNEDKDDERGGGGGDDEVDELDQEKTEGEIENEEDILDDEREGEEETFGKETDEKTEASENETFVEDRDHEGGGKNPHVAREEHYKADDASSAVAHDIETARKENETSAHPNNSTLEIGEDDRAGNGTHVKDNSLPTKSEGIVGSNSSKDLTGETPSGVHTGSSQAQNAVVEEGSGGGEGSGTQTVLPEEGAITSSIDSSHVSQPSSSSSNFSRAEDNGGVTGHLSNSSANSDFLASGYDNATAKGDAEAIATQNLDLSSSMPLEEKESPTGKSTTLPVGTGREGALME